MKVHYDIEQGTLDWHKLRWGKIGGTRGSGLFIKSDTLAIEITAEECESYQDDNSFISSDMQRGTELEPVARERLEEYSGVKFLQAGWISSTIHRVGISPDGISKDETVQCEVKCPSKKKHTEYCLGGVVPKEHIHQCIHAFLVNDKLEKLFFCSFRPESIKPMFVVELTRESEVNIGTPARPKILKVGEFVEFSRSSANAVNLVIDDMKAKLEF